MADRLRTITLEELDKLQLDEANRLYWEGEQVVTQLALPLNIDWAAWIVAVESVAIALVGANIDIQMAGAGIGLISEHN